MASKDIDAPDDEEFIQTPETWRDFLYNSNKGTVLGRTGISWLKIGVFYVIFYCFLAGWFAGLLHAFYSTLSDIHPTYYGESSLLLANPAMGVRPMPLYDSTMIRFSQGIESSYKPYTDHLEAFLKTYEAPDGAKNCSGNETVTTQDSCIMDVQGYLKSLGCSREDNYGYDAGTPCVVLKMNKLYEFTPKTYESLEAIEKDLEKNEKLGHIAFAPGHVGVSCDGQNAVDRQNIQSVQFAPRGGLSARYFPYENQKGYRSPIIVAKFAQVTKQTTIQVNCKLWATNIDNSDGKQKRGTVHFEFYIN